MPDTDTTPTPDLGAFAAAMRAVLNTTYRGALGDRPDALESWTDTGGVGGYTWRWCVAGQWWRVTAGGTPDPRPLVYGPDGYWRVDAVPSEHAAGRVLLLLRAGGAIPPAAPVDQARRYMPCCFADPAAVLLADGRRLTCDACGTRYTPPPAAAAPEYVEDHRLDEAHPRLLAAAPARAVVVRGHRFPVPPPAEPCRAVIYRASDPEPPVPFGYVTVRATTDEPDEHGRWRVTLPDGRAHTYDPAARSYLVPYEETPTPEFAGFAPTALLRFEPGQQPGIRTAMMIRDGGTLTYPTAVPGASAYTPPPAAAESRRGAA